MKKRPSVLIVDDEPNNFDVLETHLSGEPYDLHYASSGEKAIAHLGTFQPDVILLDVMMPEFNGIEICRQIKAIAKWQAVPIIMITALTAREDLAQCLAAGASDFISKPVSSVELRARVRSMLKIKEQYDNLQELLEIREDMVHMMVHDLRNPLTSIILAAELLKSPKLLLEKKEQKVNSIIYAAQRLQSLIESLLLMAKLESGKIALNYRDIDLHQLCNSIIADFEPITTQMNLQLVSNLPSSRQLFQADQPIFRRILENLLSNAIKFSDPHSQIILSAQYAYSGDLIVEVIDAGIGISEEIKSQIFEKYEIGTLIKDTSQIGLGLAFCKLAIEAHGGKINVKNNEPQGTIFTVFLPQQ
jgi:two-component system, sensor histidine kinase and response regulator